jgi:glycosyltransferase involved in cell wall biosynthesis
MSIAICRIIGNELPPRDNPGGKLATLRWILERETAGTGTARYWIVNHLHDPEYRGHVLRLLTEFGEPYDELAFDPVRYRSLRNGRERCRYAININAARNHGIRLASASHEFVACVDQDCYFLPEQWQRVLDFVERDQGECPGRRYYGLTMKRISAGASAVADADLASLRDEEPQLIFRRDARQLFDPALPFGDGDKMRLLADLGYGPSPRYTLLGDRCRCAGTVLHLAAGEPDADRDLGVRMRHRSTSIERLLRGLDSNYRVESP